MKCCDKEDAKVRSIGERLHFEVRLPSSPPSKDMRIPSLQQPSHLDEVDVDVLVELNVDVDVDVLLCREQDPK